MNPTNATAAQAQPPVGYDEIRPDIQSGDLVAWSHRELASWYDVQIQLVRVFTRSEFSHVGTAWRIGGRLFVLESVVGGVRIFPLSRLTPFYWLPMSRPWLPEAEEFALAHLGEPYSKLECIEAFFEPLTESGRWQCAKYTRAVQKANGVDLGDRDTPSDIVREAMKRYNVPLFLVETL